MKTHFFSKKIFIIIFILLTSTVSIHLHQDSKSNDLSTNKQNINNQQRQHIQLFGNSVANKEINPTIKQVFPQSLAIQFFNKTTNYFGTVNGSKYPIIVLGASDSSYYNPTPKQTTEDLQQYDVVIVGGGISGFTAAVFLTQKDKKVLILQKQNIQGGLAAYLTDKRGFFYDRGSGYWSKDYPQELQILKTIKMQNYMNDYKIEQPIDTYTLDGVMYGGHPNEGLWDNRVIGIQPPAKLHDGSEAPTLPITFAIFKLQLNYSDTGKAQIPNQPFQRAKINNLDKLSAKEWIRNMPQAFRQRIKINKIIDNKQFNQNLDGDFEGQVDGFFKGSFNIINLINNKLNVQGKFHGNTKWENSNIQLLGQYEGYLKGQFKGYLNGTYEGQIKGMYIKNTDINQTFEVEKSVLKKYDQSLSQNKLSKQQPMKQVLNFLQLYCRSALGTTLDKVSAMFFANFYISQIVPRFTSTNGTAVIIRHLKQILDKRPHLFKLQLNSNVRNIKNYKGKVQVKYQINGKGKLVKGKKCIYAATLGLAPKLIENLQKQSPQQAKIMKELKYAHYSIHNIHVTNHPYRQAYDTWQRDSKYTLQDYTDFIVARWQQLKGYAKDDLRTNFSKNPDQKGSVITIYHPLITIETQNKGKWYTEQKQAKLAQRSVNRWLQQNKNYLRQPFQIISVSTTRWPYSIHIAQPGFFNKKTQLMGRTFKNIIFGHSSQGTPAVEEALFRGHCAANKILYQFDNSFVQQLWSNCVYKE